MTDGRTLGPVALPLAIIGLLVVWSTGFVALLVLGPAAPSWAAGLLTICGYSPERGTSRLDLSVTILAQAYLFGGFVAWLYWDDLRSRLRSSLLGRLLVLGTLAPLVAISLGTSAGRLVLPETQVPTLDAPKPLPQFNLVDQNGRPVGTSDLSGRVALMTFFYSACHETCPLTIRRIQQVLDTLPSDQQAHVSALAVTVDPDNDTPPQLLHTAKAWALSPRFLLLTGNAEAVQRVATDLTIEVRVEPDGRIVHSDVVLVFDQQGRSVYRASGPTWDPTDVARLVQRLLQ